MKHFILLILGVCFAAHAANAKVETKGLTREEIQIRDVSSAPPEQIRSALPTAEAWIDFEMGWIEVEIYAPLGMAEVVITNLSGAPVTKVTVDSDAQPLVMLAIPAAGSYRITISGNGYITSGDFTVDAD